MKERIIIILMFILLIITAYAVGEDHGFDRGTDRAELAQAQVAKADQIAIQKVQAKLDDMSAKVAATETQRQVATKEIRHEVERIVERPVYRTVCVDADGLYLLDQAADIANGHPTVDITAPPDTAAGTAQAPPDTSTSELDQMMRGDCLKSMIDLYDTAGQIRAQLIGLQAQVNLTRGADTNPEVTQP